MAFVQTEIRLNGKLCLVPDAALLAAIEPGQLVNSYTCPLGKAHGTAWLLMRRGDINAIIESNTFTLEMQTDFASDDGITIPSLFFVEATRLSIGTPNDEDAPFLVQLADVRYQLNRWSDSGELLANIRSAAQDADFLTGTTGDWNTFIGLLWTSMPALGSFPGGITGEGVPEGYDLRYENSWEALNTILGNLGKAVAYDPTDATFSIVTVDASSQDPGSKFKTRVLRETETIEHDATRTPATIRVVFNRWYKNYGQEEDTSIINWQSVADEAAVKVDIATNNPSAVAGTVVTLWDDLYATRADTGLTDNTSELNDRAQARAAAWLADAEIERGQTVLVGFVTENLPGPRIKLVQWRHLGGGPETVFTTLSGQLTSEFKRPDAMPEGMEELRSPDLSRRTFPNWPRLPNIVQVNDDTSSTTQGDPNSDNLFAGFVYRIEGQITGSGSLQKKEACWIRFVDEHDSKAGDIQAKNLDFFHGRLSGTADSEASVRPLYVARRGSDASAATGLYGLANENWQDAGDSGDADMSPGETLTATNGSDQIVGSAGTLWLTELTLGIELEIDGANYNVTAVAGNTNATISPAFAGTNGPYPVAKPGLSPAPNTPWIRVNPCDDIEGANPDFSTTNTVFWANFSVDGSEDAEDPNVENQQVIGYQAGPDDRHFTEGYYSGKIGDVIRQTRTFSDKQGWKRMDGSENSLANGGTGIISTCMFVRGSSGSEAIGVKKGAKDHFHSTVIGATVVEFAQKWDTLDDAERIPVAPVQAAEAFCSTTNKDQSNCECAEPAECECEDGADGSNQCKLVVEYIHLHDLERVDNSEGYTPP